MPTQPERSSSLARLSRRQRRAEARAQARAARRAARSGPLSAGAALALGLGLNPAGAQAASFEVTNLEDSGAGSLRQAIADANAMPGADVITFQAGLSGTITLTSGQLEITDSLDLQGPGAELLSVSGNDASRVFYLYNGSQELQVVISGLTITHGSANIGAGLVNFDEDLTLDGVTITENEATGDGGGLWADGFNMDLTISDCVLSGNVSGDDGGGIYIEDTGALLQISNTRISGNQAAGNGGGIYFYDPDHDITVAQSTVSGNTAMGRGGGIYLYNMDSGLFTVRETTISGNSASAGGGLFLYNGDDQVAIESATISGNQATNGNGGGVFMYSLYNTSIDHSTIAGNSATGAGGGVFVGNGELGLNHTIVADNTADTDADIANGGNGSFAVAFSLVEAAGAAAVTDGGGNVTGMDPLLGALGDNGGPNQTHLPGATSPALDAGDAAFAAPPEFDQRGRARVANGRIDIGAVERNPGTVQLSAAAASASEADGNISLTLTRTGGSDGDIAVSFATANDSAASPDDFTAASVSVQWSNQDAADKSVAIAIADDELVESSETFSAAISNPTGGAQLGATVAATLTLNDDDSAPTISAIDDQTIDEGEETDAIEFTLDDADQDEADLVLTASSSDQDLVPDANIVFGGSGADRTVTVTPSDDQHGSATITITVSDGANEATASFTLTVEEADEPDTEPEPEMMAGAGGTSGSAGRGGDEPDPTPDAGMMTPDGGTAGSGEKPGKPTGEGSGEEPPDAGTRGGGRNSGGGGCSTAGHGDSPSGFFATTLLAIASLVSRRKRRSPGR